VRFLATAILLFACATASAQTPERFSISADYLQAAARNEALQLTDCGRFMLAGDRLNYLQAANEAKAKLTQDQRRTFEAVLAQASTQSMLDATRSATEQNVSLLSSRFSSDFACGYLIGKLYAESAQAIARFRALE
jgi:hypothetical protein